MNGEAIALAVKLGLAAIAGLCRIIILHEKIISIPIFPRVTRSRNIPRPYAENGFLEILVGKESNKIRINRIHMEEDAGKSMHDDSSDFTSLDYNRAGMPLLEIVTEPDIRSADEAFAYVTGLRKLVSHLGVCDGNMEEGSLRCDVNISVTKDG